MAGVVLQVEHRDYGVPSILMGFSIVIGMELEFLAWLSFLDSLWSLPSDLDQILP